MNADVIPLSLAIESVNGFGSYNKQSINKTNKI